MASTNLPSKLSRAIANYLIVQGAITRARCYWFGCNRVRTLENGPIVLVEVWPGRPEPKLSGNSRFMVHIGVKGDFLKEPTDTNDETDRVAFDAVVGAVRDVLMFTDDDGQSFHGLIAAINTAAWAMPDDSDPVLAANNADMTDFTLMAWEDETYGQGRAEDCAIEIVMQFGCICCEKNIEDFGT